MSAHQRRGARGVNAVRRATQPERVRQPPACHTQGPLQGGVRSEISAGLGQQPGVLYGRDTNSHAAVASSDTPHGLTTMLEGSEHTRQQQALLREQSLQCSQVSLFVDQAAQESPL